MEEERRAGEARDARGREDAAAPERDAETTNAAPVADEDDAWEYEPETSHGDLSEEREAEILGITASATAKTGVDASASTPIGPPAVILVGFRAEEWPRVRVLVDELGGYDVPVIPARSEHAWMTLEEVARTREPDWESPRDAARARGGEYGSHRAVICSGLDLGEVAVIVSAIEARGFTEITRRRRRRRKLARAARRVPRDALSDARAATPVAGDASIAPSPPPSTDPHPDALGASSERARRRRRARRFARVFALAVAPRAADVPSPRFARRRRSHRRRRSSARIPTSVS